jgi:hypothetical protein
VDYLEVLLAEYKSVRVESLEALNQIHTIVQYCLASVGVAVAAALVTSERDVTAAAIILMALVPTLIFLGILMMAFAVHRVVQARQYLRYLEEEISQKFSDPLTVAPRWERTRKVKRAAINAYRYTVAATLVAALVLGPGLGGVLLGSNESWREFVFPELAGLVYVGMVSAACVVMYRKIAEVDNGSLTPDEMPQKKQPHAIN